MKTRRFPIFMVGTIILTITVIMSAGPVLADTLTVPGTGACEPLVAELAAAYNRTNPQHRVIVPPTTGSGGGINAVLKKEASLARVARPLKPAEIQKGLAQMIFARDAVAFVVGSEVKVTRLSTDQLIAIFSGTITNWKEVGGQAGHIRVITREPGDSSLNVLREQMRGFKDIVFPTHAKVILTDPATVEILQKYKNSIGFITMSSYKWSRGGIKIIAVDTILPTRENILAGKYRLVEDYSFVYRKPLDPLAKSFIDFVFSPEGKKIIEKSDAVSVEKR